MAIYRLTVNFQQQGKAPVVLPVAAGESVLEACLDQGIALLHNCGGLCSCSTCQVYVTGGMDNLQEISGREEKCIQRALHPQLNSRLSCQCIVRSGDIEVTIPDQSAFFAD